MARKEKKYNYIYKTTCLITNKFYIGMHSTDNLDDGYIGSGKRLWFSINYHGKDNHVKEILEFLPTRKALKEREKEIVNSDLIKEELCMNLKTGGDGGFVNEEHKQKFINSDGPKNFAKKLKEDYEFRKKHSLISSERMKKTHKQGKIKYDTFTGKKHSEETKKLMSEIRKGTGVGEKNSQYGTCWITKNGINKKIKKEDINTYLNEGWVRGRK